MLQILQTENQSFTTLCKDNKKVILYVKKN
jgi:hypothetical protein